MPSPVLESTAALPATAASTSEITPIPSPPISVHDVDGNDPPRLSSYGVNPAAAYENKSNWKSTLYAGGKVVLDLVKESSDVFTPLKSVAGGLSAVLKYYDVRHSCLLSICLRMLNFESANDGEPQGNRIIVSPDRGPRGVVERACP